jgi:hypothetical protein
MRAHRGTHHEGVFHLVKLSPEIRERKSPNYRAAFVARDFSLVTPDICEQPAATVGCSEIGVREEWEEHCVKGSMLLFCRSLQDPKRPVGVTLAQRL